MSDDELGRFLRDEVPEPGPGYWEAIDRRLADVEAEAGDGGRVEGSVGAADAEAGNNLAFGGDTGADVIRLTDMNNRSDTRFSSRLPLLASAAAVVLLVAGAGFLFFRDSDTSTTEAATEDAVETDADTETDTDADADSDAVGNDLTDDGQADGGDDQSATPAPVPASIRTCYSGQAGGFAGGSENPDIVGYADFFGPLDDNPTVRIVTREVPEEQPFYSVIDGTVGGDGIVDGSFNNLTAGTRSPAVFVSVNQDTLSLADDVFINQIDCDIVSDDVAGIESVVEGLLVADQEATGGAIIGPDSFPTVWSIELDGATGRAAPSRDADVVFEYPADASDLLGTGRIATNGEEIWVEIDSQNDAGDTWWVSTDFLMSVYSFRIDAERSVFVTADRVDGRDRPGSLGAVTASFDSGTYLIATGIEADAAGSVWVEIDAADGREASWVAMESLQAPYPNRLCFAETAVPSTPTVLVMDWDENFETFTGFFRTGADTEASADYATVAGRVLDVDLYAVNVLAPGQTEPVGEQWDRLSASMSTPGRPELPDVNCTLVTSENLLQSEAATDFTYPPLP